MGNTSQGTQINIFLEEASSEGDMDVTLSKYGT
jgi:hypothetical protein